MLTAVFCSVFDTSLCCKRVHFHECQWKFRFILLSDFFNFRLLLFVNAVVSLQHTTKLIAAVVGILRVANTHDCIIFTCASYAEARLSYRLDVRPSVTRWYCIKTAEHIVMLSSPHDSPFILVLCISRSSQNSNGVIPCGAANQR